MAKIWIAEFQNISQRPSHAPIAYLNSLKASQAFEFSGATDSDPFTENTRYIRVQSDTDCHIRVSSAGDNATVDDLPITAGFPEYFAVEPEGILSVIAAA